jgi:uncharacterized cupin superfamily protein
VFSPTVRLLFAREIYLCVHGEVHIDDVENSVQPTPVRHQLTAPLGEADVAINYLRFESGDIFAFVSHGHEVQKELFYVQTTTASFETGAGAIDINVGEIVRFPAGKFQRE